MDAETRAAEERLAKLRRLKELRDQAAQTNAPPAEEPSTLGKIWEAISPYKNDAPRGAGNALASLIPNILPIANATAKRVGADPTAALAGQVREEFPLDGRGNEWVRAGLEGLGAGVVTGPQGFMQAPVTATAASLGGSLGTKGAEKAANNFLGESNDGPMGGIKQLISLLGGLAGGTAGGLAASRVTGLRQNSAEKRLHDATSEIPDAGWDAAGENVRRFNRAGSSTHTLADAVPGNTSLGGLAERVRASEGGQGLAARTAGRGEDIANLRRTAQDAAYPAPVETNTVANQVAQAADNMVNRMKGLRSTAYGETIRERPVLPARDVAGIHRDLRVEGQNSVDPNYGRTLEDLSHALLDTRGGRTRPITDLQALSSAIKANKENPAGPHASAGVVHDKHNVASAVARLEEELGGIAPNYRRANEQFRNMSRQFIEPMEQGPIGRVADRNPLTAGPTPESRLGNIVRGNSPEVAADLVDDLSRQGGQRLAGGRTTQDLTQGAPVDPAQLVRAMLQANTRATPEHLTAIHARGNSGNTQLLGDRLQSADDLGRLFQGTPGHAGVEPLPLTSLPLRSNWFTERMARVTGERAANREISDILTGHGVGPTPENLARLREIAQYDPNVRRMLILSGAIAPQLAEGGK